MRCVNCGLLAMRRKSDASLAEVPGYIREKDPTTRTAVVNKFEDEHEITPVCIAGQCSFSPKKEEYTGQFKKWRWCWYYHKYHQGLSPQEHVRLRMEIKLAMVGFAGVIIGALITLAGTLITGMRS